MLVKGWFDESGRPRARGLLFIPALNVHGNINFIVDTGSDATTIMPGDGKRLNIYSFKMKYDCVAYGAGGQHSTAGCKGHILFLADDKYMVRHNLTIQIQPDDADQDFIPSLLGMDILRKWNVVINYSKHILDFEIITHDGIESI